MMCFMTNTVLMHIRTTCVLMHFKPHWDRINGDQCHCIGIEKCGCGKVAQSKTCKTAPTPCCAGAHDLKAHLNASTHSWVSLLQKATVWALVSPSTNAAEISWSSSNATAKMLHTTEKNSASCCHQHQSPDQETKKQCL